MSHFSYKNNVLNVEEVSIFDIAKQVGTPFYCYSTNQFIDNYNLYAKAFSDIDANICFAVKSNSNIAVLKILAQNGAGGDCVSEGEIRRCLKAGISSDKIVFSGVGKTKQEMKYALENKIFQFNVESKEELFILNEVASELGVRAPIAFRVNPDVDAGTHEKISTGRKEDKFGIAIDDALDIYKIAASLDNINVQAVATHIGSQLLSLDPLEAAFKKLVDLIKILRSQGHNISVMDCGGGLGINYKDEVPPTIESYANMVKNVTKDIGCKLLFEPGRSIAGNSGILVSSVIYLKETSHRKFLVIDAAMNDLVRPAIYNAYHEIVPVIDNNDQLHDMDVVGPICETGDIFAKNRQLPLLKMDDLVAIKSAGAYGAVMSSTYNSRSLISEILVTGNDFKVIRKKQSLEELLDMDIY